MKVDWNYKMVGWDGLPLTENDRIVTLRDVVINALLAPGKGDSDGLTKFRRYEMALKVRVDGDLVTEEIAEIKKLIGIVNAPLFVGQAWRILEGHESGL